MISSTMIANPPRKTITPAVNARMNHRLSGRRQSVNISTADRVPSSQRHTLGRAVIRAPIVLLVPPPMLPDSPLGRVVDLFPQTLAIQRFPDFLDPLVHLGDRRQREPRMSVLVLSERRDVARPGGLEFRGSVRRRRP